MVVMYVLYHSNFIIIMLLFYGIHPLYSKVSNKSPFSDHNGCVLNLGNLTFSQEILKFLKIV